MTWITAIQRPQMSDSCCGVRAATCATTLFCSRNYRSSQAAGLISRPWATDPVLGRDWFRPVQSRHEISVLLFITDHVPKGTVIRTRGIYTAIYDRYPKECQQMAVPSAISFDPVSSAPLGQPYSV